MAKYLFGDEKISKKDVLTAIKIAGRGKKAVSDILAIEYDRFCRVIEKENLESLFEQEKSPVYLEVAQYLEDHGHIDTTKVYEILHSHGSYKSKPSTIIDRLRKWGVKLKSRRISNRVTMWEKNRDGKDLICHRGECSSCRTSVFVSLPEGEEPGGLVCEVCKTIPERPRIFSNHEPGSLSGECKVYRPGDEGFDERAAECTPPSQIKEQSWGGRLE